MFLTVHAASGIFIGSQVSNPWLAFVLGYLAHWVLDAIPHGDNKLIDKTKYLKANYNRLMFYIASVDTLGIIILFSTLTDSGAIILTSGILWGMLGAVAPDYLWGVYRITQLKFLKPIHKLHHWFHHNLIKDNLPVIWGAVIQLTVLITFIILITYL